MVRGHTAASSLSAPSPHHTLSCPSGLEPPRHQDCQKPIPLYIPCSQLESNVSVRSVLLIGTQGLSSHRSSFNPLFLQDATAVKPHWSPSAFSNTFQDHLQFCDQYTCLPSLCAPFPGREEPCLPSILSLWHH